MDNEFNGSQNEQQQYQPYQQPYDTNMQQFSKQPYTPPPQQVYQQPHNRRISSHTYRLSSLRRTITAMSPTVNLRKKGRTWACCSASS